MRQWMAIVSHVCNVEIHDKSCVHDGHLSQCQHGAMWSGAEHLSPIRGTPQCNESWSCSPPKLKWCRIPSCFFGNIVPKQQMHATQPLMQHGHHWFWAGSWCQCQSQMQRLLSLNLKKWAKRGAGTIFLPQNSTLSFELIWSRMLHCSTFLKWWFMWKRWQSILFFNGTPSKQQFVTIPWKQEIWCLVWQR